MALVFLYSTFTMIETGVSLFRGICMIWNFISSTMFIIYPKNIRNNFYLHIVVCFLYSH